ncbi:MAG: cytochrome C [Polaromonas sp. 28-63-22]|nr:MAG: cytochrome C [Polaromonas sp. 28-63-22]
MKFHQLFVPLVAGFLSLALLPASGQDIAAGKAKAQACAACQDYKEGRRTDPVMTPMATSLSRQEMIDIANYFAAQPAKPSTYKTDDAKIKLGKAKADETLCSMCHLGAFAGQNEIPRVAGQQYDYVVKQLRDFKARKRTNDAGNMTSVAQTLSDADIENLAQYITSLR